MNDGDISAIGGKSHVVAQIRRRRIWQSYGVPAAKWRISRWSKHMYYSVEVRYSMRFHGLAIVGQLSDANGFSVDNSSVMPFANNRFVCGNGEQIAI